MNPEPTTIAPRAAALPAVAPGRPLGAAERAWGLADTCGPTNTLVVARVAGPLDTGLLADALGLLQQRHALLGARVAAGQFAPGAGPIPLRVLPPAGEDGWREAAEEELNAPLDWHVGPPARAVYLPPAAPGEPADLILTLHHGATDGAANVQLVRQWLEYARQLLAGDRPAVEPRLLPPASDARLPGWAWGWGGAWRGARLGARLLRGLVLQRPRLIGTPGAAATRCSRIVHRQLAPEQVAQLATRCRREDTTIYGALYAAMLLAARAALPGRGKLPLGGLSFVNLRRELAPPVEDEELGCFVSTVYQVQALAADAAFWPLARAAGAELAAARRRGDPELGLRLVPWVVQLHLATGRHVFAALALSNIGRLAIPETYGPLHLQALHAASSVNGLAPGCAGLVTTLAGRMYWNFVFPEPLLAPAAREAFADRAVAALLAACA